MDSAICLTCLCKPSQAHNLNEVIWENLKILEILHQLVPPLLNQTECTLPDTICDKCVEQLVICSKFRKQCLDSVRKLWSENYLISNKQERIAEHSMEAEHVDCTATDMNTNVENPLESSTSIKDLKISLDEIAIDPLAANNVLSHLDKQDDCNKESLKRNGEDAVNDNENNCKGVPGKSRREAVEEPVPSSQCKLCNKIFKQAQGLASHMSKTHFKKHLYHCQKCDKGFSMEELFIRHCNRHLGIKPFPCTHCDKAFDTKSSLNQHLLCHSKESSYTCNICGKTFYRIDVYKQHIQRHEDKEQFQCVKCNRRFKCFSDHIKHLRKHKNENYNHISADIETKSLNGNQIVEMPLEQILTEFKPENKESVSKIENVGRLDIKQEENESVDFKDHENSESMLSTESAQCDICNQIFKNSQGLARHRSSTHFKKHLYQCDQCERGFSVEEFYIKHRNRHLGIKTFKCKQCDKAFETNSILNQHLISHSKLTPHLCTICGKSFRRLDGLRQHMLRHGEERPYKCSICTKSFKCHSDKLKHIIKHDGKRYECDICGSRLATPESLSQHKMTHTGEKPFKCAYCDKSFISLSNMKCHERIHTGEKPYKCQYCWKSFRQSNDRKKHTNRVHNNEQKEKSVEEKL